MPLRFAPLQRFPHSPAPAAGPVRPAHSPSTCGRTQLAGGEGRGRWRGLRVVSVPGWGALGGCVGGRISTPTVRAQDRRPVARRLSEVSAAPSVVVGARCAGEVAGGQPHALLGPLARREQRRARGGDGRRLALRQGSEGTHTHGSHRRARVGRVQGGRHQAVAAVTAACSLKRTCAFDMSKPVLLVHQMDAIYGRPPPDRAVPRATAEQKARAARTFPQPSPAIRGLVGSSQKFRSRNTLFPQLFPQLISTSRVKFPGKCLECFLYFRNHKSSRGVF